MDRAKRRHQSKIRNQKSKISNWETTLMFMDHGKITSGTIISHRLPLNEIAVAFHMMLEHRQYFNKVMILQEK